MLTMLDMPRRTTAARARAALSRFVFAVLEAADAVLMWPFRTSEKRRLLESLAAMGDHELKDIGLSRQDLRDALALPLAQDTGCFFAARRGDRRLWR